jgi:hypothetical protein
VLRQGADAVSYNPLDVTRLLDAVKSLAGAAEGAGAGPARAEGAP